MMQILVFIVTHLIFTQCIAQNCVYTDPATGYKLYLDALEHTSLMITAEEAIDKHTYTYTPCRNAAGECPNSSGSDGLHTSMCRQTLITDPSVCTVIADMNSSVMPTYNPSGNGTWQFQFQNGDDEGCGAPRTINIFFMCDMSAGDYQIQSAGELHSSCNYEYNIRTKWACPGENTTTTSIPVEDCKWNANNGENILDLSSFDNYTVVAQMDSSAQLSYLYSPCRNELSCNNTMNMIQLNNVLSLGCKQYLAIWETTQHTVNYNSVDKSWQFIYTNGEKCNGFQSIMTIIWTCDETVDHYKVVKADTIAPCQNILEIKSKNACT